MKLLLHSCCAPCSVSCVTDLRNENIAPHLFWHNPNIHPYTEYKSRRDCLIEFAKKEKLELIVNDEYNVDSFLSSVYGKIESRCEMCYRFRLEKASLFAVKEGFDAFSTTLLISPYQNHEAIKKIGEEIAQKNKINFYYKDFRPLFREGQNAARKRNFYMQKYCGCIFSEEERNIKRNSRQDTKNAKNAKDENKFSLDLLSVSLAPLPLSENKFNRISLLTGENALKKFNQTSVLVFGAGGVGSWAAEALVRSGIGKIGIIDNDTICASNINRQMEATTLTLGMPKASTLKTRLLEINPECEIRSWDELFCMEKADIFGIDNADYVIDAIDSINHKLDLIETVCNTKAILFSSMGMALKLDPLKIKTASIWKTDVCPLARIVRQGLRKREFSGDFTVVYSDEPALENKEENASPYVPGEKRINGSIVTVTASAGLTLASLVINDILRKTI